MDSQQQNRRIVLTIKIIDTLKCCPIMSDNNIVLFLETQVQPRHPETYQNILMFCTHNV